MEALRRFHPMRHRGRHWDRARLSVQPLSSAGTVPPRLASIHAARSEEHTSELQSRGHLVCRLLLVRRHPASTLFPYTTLFRSSSVPVIFCASRALGRNTSTYGSTSSIPSHASSGSSLGSSEIVSPAAFKRRNSSATPGFNPRCKIGRAHV